MATLTSWSLTAPNGTHYQPSIGTNGIVTWSVVGAAITVTPPVLVDRDDPSNVWTLAIDNATIVTITRTTDSGQNRAALVDANGTTYAGVVVSSIWYFLAPQVAVGDLVAVGEFEEETVYLLVRSIEPGPDLTAKITAVEAAPGVHLAASGAIPPFDSHITLPAQEQTALVSPHILGIASDEFVMLPSLDGSLIPRIVLSLQFPSTATTRPTHVEVQYRLAGSAGPYERVIDDVRTLGLITISLVHVVEGLTYEIRVRGLADAGLASQWVMIARYGVLGKQVPPPAVTGLHLNEDVLVWSYPDPPPDLAGFRVRVHVGTRTSWSDAMPLHDGLITESEYPLWRDSSQRTYLVVAVDTSGLESDPALVVVEWGSVPTRNVVERVDHRLLSWPGTLTGGDRIGSQVQAQSIMAWWSDDLSPWWTSDADPWWSGAYGELEYLATLTPLRDWLGGVLLIDATVQGPGWRIEYAVLDPAALWTDDADPLWTDDAAAWWSTDPAVYQPWPGQFTGYQVQAYALRFTIPAGATQGVLSQLALIVDVPDVSETLVGVAIAATGTRLPLANTYRHITVVQPSVVGTWNVVGITVYDKSTDGPLVFALDPAGNTIDGMGDFVVQGY
jgi:hypothetical protein